MKSDEFLSLGVQLIPVLWVVLAIETRWLGLKANERGTNLRLTLRAMLVTYSFPVGGIALFSGLLAILIDQEILKILALAWMIPSLAVSIFVSVLGLLQALYNREPIHDGEH